jgi:DNA-binding LytR/AlgR family response regulator
MYLDGDSPAWRVSGPGWPRRPDGVSPPSAGRPLRSVIVDADRLARRHLQQLLQNESEIELVAECDAGGALQPYDVHALASRLMRGGAERLRAAVAHARSLLLRDRRGTEERLLALLDQRDAERQRRSRLLIRQADSAFFLRTESIDWIEAADKLVRIHAGKHVYEQREALARIERHLDPDQFVRVSRSAIVNIDRIREIQPWFNGEHLVLLDDDSQVPTSRHYRMNLRRLLGRGDGP